MPVGDTAFREYRAAVELVGVVFAGMTTVWLPPVVVDDTLTVIRHRPALAAPIPVAAGTVPPVSTTAVPPALAVTVPPQVLAVTPGATMEILGFGSAPASVSREVRLTSANPEPTLSLTISIV